MRLPVPASALAFLLTAALPAAQGSAQGTVTTGEAPGRDCGVVTRCTSGLRVNFNPQLCGTVVAADQTRWAVPSTVHEGAAAVDIYHAAQSIGTLKLLLDTLVLARHIAQAPAR